MRARGPRQLIVSSRILLAGSIHVGAAQLAVPACTNFRLAAHAPCFDRISIGRDGGSIGNVAKFPRLAAQILITVLILIGARKPAIAAVPVFRLTANPYGRAIIPKGLDTEAIRNISPPRGRAVPGAGHLSDQKRSYK